MVTVVQSASGSGFNASDHGSLTNATVAGNTILLGVNALSTASSISAGASSMSDATNGSYALKALSAFATTVTGSTTNTLTAVTGISPALTVGNVYGVSGAGIAATSTLTVTGSGTTGTLSIAATATGTPTLTLGAPHYPGGIITQFGVFPAAAALGAAAAISWNVPNASAVEWTIWELSPCTFDQASAGSGVNASTNHETAICSAITPGANGAFVGALAMLDDGVGAGTIGAVGTAAAWTLLLSGGGGSGDWGSEYLSQSTAASVTGDFKLTRAGTYVGSQISLIPSGGGGGGSSPISAGFFGA